MYDAEEEAWRELARKQEQQRLDEALERFINDYKPEASPSLIRVAFEAGWRAAKE
jgi:hypothetical protein